MTYDDENEDDVLFVDTAGSWEGRFPKPNKHCFWVEIQSPFGDYPLVCVSDRYVGAIDHTNAACLAVDAWYERNEGCLAELMIPGCGFRSVFFHVRIVKGKKPNVYGAMAIQGIVRQDNETFDWTFETDKTDEGGAIE